jgi:hypothetical protein
MQSACLLPAQHVDSGTAVKVGTFSGRKMAPKKGNCGFEGTLVLKGAADHGFLLHTLTYMAVHFQPFTHAFPLMFTSIEALKNGLPLSRIGLTSVFSLPLC